MKRIKYPLLATLISSLILSPVFLPVKKAQAAPLLDLQLQQKLSIDIIQKVLDGKLLERVPVVIQQDNDSGFLLDLVLQLLGATDIGKLRNLQMRVATLAIQDVLEAGYRTPDIAEGTGGYVVTTSEFGEMICQAVTEIADMRHAYHAV